MEKSFPFSRHLSHLPFLPSRAKFPTFPSQNSALILFISDAYCAIGRWPDAETGATNLSDVFSKIPYCIWPKGTLWGWWDSCNQFLIDNLQCSVRV